MRSGRSIGVVMALVAASCGGGNGSPPSTVALDPVQFDALVSDVLDDTTVNQMVAGDLDPPEFNSDPATSGPHAGQWARCGVYRQEIPDIFLVHSLKRGSIVIHYDPALGPAEIDTIEDLVRSTGSNVIAAPRAGLASPIVLAAWTRLLSLAGADPGVIESFIDQFSKQAPDNADCPLEIDE